MRILKTVLAIIFSLVLGRAEAQDSLDVTFRYYASDNVQRVFVPGEFNNWGNNNDTGRISNTDGSLMEEDEANGFWYKTIRLEIGGGEETYQGASGYAYKFHEHLNANGSSNNWFTDPLNNISVGQNNDSFVEITHPMIFQMQPENAALVDETDEIWATVSAKNDDPVDTQSSTVSVNGAEVSTFEGFYDQDRKLLSITDLSVLNLQSGDNSLELVVMTESGESREVSVTINYQPNVEPELAQRPAGLKDGITYGEDESSVTLSLFAPGKEYVYVIGDFNDWKADESALMKKDELNADSTWHWLEIEGLTPGEQYGFQYLVNGELRISDPYSSLILDPFNDQYISENTFPDLLAYPLDEPEGWVTVIEPGKAEYEWEVTDFEPPAKSELVIYELLLRDFLEESNFQTLTDTLDYLDNLGVNAIELMPVSEFDGNLSWGYNPNHHLALDKAYGTPEAFKRFIDEAHKRGIAVILDVVMNHATGVNPLYQLYGSNNPYFNDSPRHSYNVFNDFNHQYSGTQYYNRRMIEHWISEYKVDGFRWDLTKGFTQNCTESDFNCTNVFQQDRVDLLKKYADYQWELNPDFYVIFEHLGTEEEEAEWANYRVDEGKGVMFWGNMNSQYSEATMGYDSNIYGVLSESRSSFEKPRLIGYMESHDQQWLMLKNRKFGNSNGDYDITNVGTALDRQKLAGAFFLTLPGPKMLWQFGELGYGGGPQECLKPGDGSDGDCFSSDPGRIDQKPIRWDYFEIPARKKVYQTWSALLHLRNSSEAFRNPEASEYSLLGDFKSVVYKHEDTDVVIIGNFDVRSRSTNFSYTTTGTWYDYFSGDSFDVADIEQSITLEPGEFKIFTTREFESPEEGILTDIEEGGVENPVSFQLNQNYPNPFNPSTVISYQLAGNSEVSLKVFDMLGREVVVLVNERKAAGAYQVDFDASNLSSGMYIYRLQAGGKVFTQKMMLIK